MAINTAFDWSDDGCNYSYSDVAKEFYCVSSVAAEMEIVKPFYMMAEGEAPETSEAA